MSNPLGSGGAGSPEDRNEFVEIFNMGSVTIDLDGWMITDFDAVDEIISFSTLSGNSNTVISPGEFALIMDPEYVDSGENYMPYGIPTCILLTIGNTTIGDGLSTTDPIALISPDGDTVSTYYHPFDPGDGISVEKVYPNSYDFPGNWKSCIDISGSTPGRENSVYSTPDFSLDSLWVDDNNVFVILSNPYDTVLGGTVEIFSDLNRNRIFDEGELIESIVLAEIPQDSSFRFDFSLSSEGFYVIGFDLINEVVLRRVRSGEGISDLVISEIMYAPSGPPEWIELFNRSECDIALDSFKIDEVAYDYTEIASGDYLVITSDSTAFLGYYGEISCPLFKGSLSFSNDGDSVVLLDENYFVLDKLIYFGNEVDGNYSLERVNPDISGGNSTNWGQSVTEGGTPGEANSIFAEYRREDISLAVTPRHFTPDGDGEDETSIVSFNLPYLRNEVMLKIFDRRGHLLRENSGVYGGETGEWIWDGKDKRGEVVPTGLYIVLLVIEDADESAITVEKAVVSVGR